MSTIMEEYAAEVGKKEAKKEAKKIAFRLIKAGKQTYEEIAELTDLSLEEVEELAGEKTA